MKGWQSAFWCHVHLALLEPQVQLIMLEPFNLAAVLCLNCLDAHRVCRHLHLGLGSNKIEASSSLEASMSSSKEKWEEGDNSVMGGAEGRSMARKLPVPLSCERQVSRRA
jgi:hypothetical protein